MMTRRSLLGFLAAAPFIVKAAGLMPVRSFAAEVALPPDMAFTDWLVISGVDQYGLYHAEAIRCVPLSRHTTTISWQQIDHIVHVDGSFAKRMPT